MSGYTVVDLETTGLFPQMHDRIVEVAVVQLSDQGHLESEWSTLVNPERDVGPTEIHGITTRDVLQAPTFAEVAPHVLNEISGRTVVAHNARFDLRFLDAEFERADVGTVPPSPGLCTMELSRRFIRGASRKLKDCCAAARVPHNDAHSALGDARGAAGLLVYYLAKAGVPVPWDDVIRFTRAHRWPPGPDPMPTLRMLNRNQLQRRPAAWLDRITSLMPRNDDPVVDAYLDVLEQAMLDHYISAHEEEALVGLAITLGLSRDQLAAIHAMYLDTMAAAALADGVVTETERHELDQAASMLGLPRRLVDAALKRAGDAPQRPTGFTLKPGDQVVFTGALSVDRDEWVTRAEHAGLVHGGVTKRTALVVAADPDSQSGKAAKARSYNVPVVTEAAFARMLDTMRAD